MVPPVPNYDPSVIELAADRLYGKATSVLAGSVVTGVVVGAGFGAIPLTSLGAAWPIPSAFGFATMLAGGLVGGLVGYVVGDARAFGYRLQAQSALSQLALERNTARAADALAALAGARPAPRAAPAQRPTPAHPAPPRSVAPPSSVAPPTRA